MYKKNLRKKQQQTVTGPTFVGIRGGGSNYFKDGIRVFCF